MANELQVLIKESGLEKSKAQYMLERFQDDFQVAAEWEAKVKTIVVTDASQIGMMKMARAGRLFLREKRIAIKHAHDHLKQQSLREGRAIDGIANILKDLIVPMEEHLYRQEHFVALKLKAEEEQKRIEAEQQAERDRLAREKAEAEEQERIRLENIRLQKEADAREKKLFRERMKRHTAEEAQKAALAKTEAAKAAIAAAERAKKEAEARAKAAKTEAVEAEKKRRKAEKQQAQAKIDMEQRLAAAEKERKEMEAIAERLNAREAQRVEEQAAEYHLIICPYCNGKIRVNPAGEIIQ